MNRSQCIIICTCLIFMGFFCVLMGVGFDVDVSVRFGQSQDDILCDCNDPITDGCITLCTGDIDPADPLEDETMYH